MEHPMNSPAGVLSRLPLDIRQQIYDHMCRIDCPPLRFEIEGPNTIHVPANTLERLQRAHVPRVAHVCAEMRHYVLGAATTPIALTCYVFAPTLYETGTMLQIFSVVERRAVTGVFRFRSDTVTFRAHEVAVVEQYGFGEGEWVNFDRSRLEAWGRTRQLLLSGSGFPGCLPPSDSPGGRHTPFEEFVRAARDDYVAEHPEAVPGTIRISRGGIDRVHEYNQSGPEPVELISQHRLGVPHYVMLQRCYDFECQTCQSRQRWHCQLTSCSGTWCQQPSPGL